MRLRSLTSELRGGEGRVFVCVSGSLTSEGRGGEGLCASQGLSLARGGEGRVCVCLRSLTSEGRGGEGLCVRLRSLTSELRGGQGVKGMRSSVVCLRALILRLRVAWHQ